MKENNRHKSEGHRQRLRDRFLAGGLEGFHDYEVIELLLTLFTPRKDCKDEAKALLKRFKTLQQVFEAPVSELCEIKGIGPKNVFGLKLIPAVSKRFLEKKIVRSEALNNAETLFHFLYHSMSAMDRECFKVLFLDAKNRVMAVETMFEGTLTASSVYPREVVRAALNHKAAAVIFAHNHPSGDPEPSHADMEITRRLVLACMTLGITVHEHLVVGDGCYYSFADHGHIARMRRQFDQLD